nr:Metazoa galactosyltransferase domain containing protein [Haemonchus contortus]
MPFHKSFVSQSCSRKRTLFGILLFIAALFTVFGFITDFPTWQTDGFFVFHAITRNFNQTADSGTTRPSTITYPSSFQPVPRNSSQTASSSGTNLSLSFSTASYQPSLQPVLQNSSQTAPSITNRSTAVSIALNQTSLQPLSGPNNQTTPSRTKPPSTASYHSSLQPVNGPSNQTAPSSTNLPPTTSYHPTLQPLPHDSSQAAPQSRSQTAPPASAPQNSTRPTPSAANISSTISYQSSFQPLPQNSSHTARPDLNSSSTASYPSNSSSIPYSNKTDNYPSCSQRLKFVGRINVSMEEIPLQKLEEKFKYLKPGGHYIPDGCKPMNRVAIIIPFRDRESHLHILLNNMHPFLANQMLDYSIIVVEQIANQTFNRAKLLNVGYVEANKMYDWQCYIFHDVDLLPEDDRNLHVCPDKNPRHMAVAINKFNYKLFYQEMFGTSSALTKDQFNKTNGFSNRYWGWGGEDDDMYNRVIYAGYQVDRYNETVARYTMIKHEHEPKANPINPCRYKLLEHTKDDWKGDGLNSLKYKILNITSKPLFTHILVDLLEAEERASVEAKLCH